MGLTVIHVGKCGGLTLISLLEKHKIPHSHVHIKKPVFNSADKYIILLRNPIDRFISAFNWRYKLVVFDKSQENRFPGEKKILAKYTTVNSLAENIADFDIQKTYIHHIRENIDFYLSDFLTKCQKENILGVVTQENLNNDIHSIFNIRNDSIHINKNTKIADKYLSDTGYDSLKKYLQKDYECIDTLFAMGCLSAEQYYVLSR